MKTTTEATTEEAEELRNKAQVQLRVERIERGLKEIQSAFQTIKRVGIHREILIAYLHDRTKLGKRDIEEVLFAQDEFFKRLTLSAEPKAKPQ